MIQTVGRIREDIDKTQIGRIREPRETFIFPFTPSDEDDKKRPIYNEARIISYSDLLQYVATGVLPEETKRIEEEKAWDMIVDYDLMKIYRKTLMDQLGYKYGQAKDVLKRLVNRGLLEYDGKGFRRNDRSISEETA
jgi:beta-glucosidase/6-phospho-beta-glucosidase/beta-galactosidase